MVSVNQSNSDQDRFRKRQRESIIFLLKPKSTVAYLEEHSTIRQGLEKMKFHGYAAIPVIAENGAYLGTVSEGDFLWHILTTKKYSLRSQEKHFVKDLIRPGWNPAVTIDKSLSELIPRIMEQNFVPIVDDRGSFMGIITRKDVIKHYYDIVNVTKSMIPYKK